MKNVIKMFVAIAVVGVMSVSAFAQGAGPGGAKGGAKAGAQGQRGPGGPGGPGGGGMRRGGGRLKMDEEVLAKLNLTDGQKSKVKALKETTMKKSQELMKSFGFGAPGGGKPGAGAKPGAGGKPGAAGAPGAGGRPDPAKMKEMRDKMKPIMDGYTKGMKGILTPPQFTAYEKGMKEAMDKMRAQFGGGKGPGGPGGPAGAKGAGKGAGKGTKPPTA